MRRRRRRRHHKPPSNRITTTGRLHHSGTGTAAEEEPMMIRSHMDDDDGDRTRLPVVHLQQNVIARLMGIDAAVATPPLLATRKPVAGGTVQFQAQRRQTNKCSLRLPYCPSSYRAGRNRNRNWNDDDDAEYSGPTSYAAAEPAAAMPDDSVVVMSPSTATASPRAAAAAPAAQAQDLPPNSRRTPIVLLKPTACSQSDTRATGGGVAIGGVRKAKTVVALGPLPELHRDANMSALLQEVKDRVQSELTVLTAASATEPTGCGELIKAPRASALAIPLPPPLQQTVTKDKEDRGDRRLFRRSDSFRAFRRDRKRNAGTPPPPAAAATTQPASSLEAHSLKSETVSPEKAGEESMTDASLSVLPGIDGQSFRSECLTLTKHRDEASPSPRRLFRSFSAPEPGFAFSLGRLFSFKQHEASEPAAAVRMPSKSVVVVSAAGFSSFIRGTVSSLKLHGFSSTRKLKMLRRRTHWSWSNNNNKASLAERVKMEMPICAATTTPPSPETFNLFKVAQATLSELPPSPVSPLEVVAAGHSSRHFFTDVLHLTLPMPELSPTCLSELEAPAVHRMLFDLANEALQSLVVAESSSRGGGSASSLRQWVVDSTGVSRGKKLVDDVWRQVQALRNHHPQPQAQEMQTIDGMVAYEVRRSSAWAEVLYQYEHVYVVASKIERAIFDELIQDLFFLECARSFHMV